MRKYNGKN